MAWFVVRLAGFRHDGRQDHRCVRAGAAYRMGTRAGAAQRGPAHFSASGYGELRVRAAGRYLHWRAPRGSRRGGALPHYPRPHHWNRLYRRRGDYAGQGECPRNGYGCQYLEHGRDWRGSGRIAPRDRRHLEPAEPDHAAPAGSDEGTPGSHPARGSQMTPKAGVTFSEAHKVGPYAEALREAGVEPVLISPGEPRALAGLQGLMLSGGQDLNPSRYGESPEPSTESPDDARDDLEIRLLAEALAEGLPVLAICRGMQLFNVAHGGTLIQDLENRAVHCVPGQDKAMPVHEILVEPGSRLAAILGEGAHAVNSRHHQAVGRVGA